MTSAPRLRMPAWAPLAAACLGQGMVVLDATIVNVALPSIRRGLHLGQTELQWVVNAYLLALGGLILLGGRIGDHYGRKRIYLIGGVIFSIASLAGGVAPSGAVLLAARGVQGIGAALLAPGTLSLLTAAYTEPRARTRALAVLSAVSASAGAIGVLLGGATLVEHVRAEGDHAGLDVPGALTITAGLTALVYGVVESESHSWGSPHTLIALAIAVVLLALAVVIESHVEHPLVPFAVVRRGPVATAVALMGILGAVITATIYFQSLFLQQVRGLSPLDAGLLMLPSVSLIVFMTPLAAYVTTRLGPRVVVIGGLLVAAAGTLWQSRWGAHGSIVVQMVLPSAVFALGGSVSFFATSVLLTSEIDREYSGLGSGLFNAGRQLGGSLGLAVMAVVAAAHARTLSGGRSALTRSAPRPRSAPRAS